ncbi:hydroxymethylglutaryl-CoA synthase [Vagococcus entomophilus]|uniref:Hydroxymethylglutaryl-CoA synthase n=1 Tax=Vagococcus entomophilus TaxID=1160095 RepID=A0A430AK85_9ENTE|nr:hydroxymethylglutaryl-CoA synthase [Vagococcus entomophilus]RSU08521.1 hydroxymethylglutaryl-CoA synthase [Vagococcus entomophilus]
MTVGIDKLSFYVPKYFVDLTKLAKKRNVDPNKYTIGIGQEKMSVLPIYEDIVTMGANAARKILTKEDKETIDMVIVGTESGIDFSKASAVSIHHLLEIQPFARCFEIKEACYGATAAITMAQTYVATHPNRKVLVIASDVARYGLNTAGEPTQGAGAVALLITSEPRILAFNNDNVFHTKDIMDFWRPTYSENAMVDGHLSNQAYIDSFQTVFHKYCQTYQKNLNDFDAMCFHIPYTKMGKKALQTVLDTTDVQTQTKLLTRYESSILYSKQVGNMYTGSLYLGFISLLENSQELTDGKTVALFSYGSGAVAEMFSGQLQKGFKQQLATRQHAEMFHQRQELSVTEYEEVFMQKIEPGTDWYFDSLNIEKPNHFYLNSIVKHARSYSISE